MPALNSLNYTQLFNVFRPLVAKLNTPLVGPKPQLLLPKAYHRFPRLATKFREHAKDFVTVDLNGFYNRAVNLADSPESSQLLSYTGRSGWKYRLNSRTGEFVSIRPNGEIATFFRRKSGVMDYWNAQLAND